MAARDRRNRRSRLKALRDNPRLLIVRPASHVGRHRQSRGGSLRSWDLNRSNSDTVARCQNRICHRDLSCVARGQGGESAPKSVPLEVWGPDTAYGGTPIVLVWAAATIGMGLIGAGFVWEIIRYRAERRRLARKKIVVVEARGLRDTSGAPLIESLPSKFQGQRDQVLVDIRQRVKDGEIVAPEAALEDLISLPADLKRRESGYDRRDLTLVYGGLTPVPFTFLTGVLIDDEGTAFILDWDRHAESWRELNGVDDGKRFRVRGLDNVPVGTNEVALAVSVSYAVNADDIRARLCDIPVVELVLEDGSPDCHWSEEKQRALGKQFLDMAITLGNRGVRRIHLFLAAQNSIAFRFGRLYDKRNLPEVAIYQYKRGAVPPYPWSVLMPVCGIDRPTIIL